MFSNDQENRECSSLIKPVFKLGKGFRSDRVSKLVASNVFCDTWDVVLWKCVESKVDRKFKNENVLEKMCKKRCLSKIVVHRRLELIECTCATMIT